MRNGKYFFGVVAREAKDLFAFFAMTTEFQRYESKLSSGQIVKILGDTVDVSPFDIDQPDIWEALMPRAMLEKVDVFSKFVGLNPELYVKHSVENMRTPARPASRRRRRRPSHPRA